MQIIRTAVSVKLGFICFDAHPILNRIFGSDFHRLHIVFSGKMHFLAGVVQCGDGQAVSVFPCAVVFGLIPLLHWLRRCFPFRQSFRLLPVFRQPENQPPHEQPQPQPPLFSGCLSAVSAVFCGCRSSFASSRMSPSSAGFGEVSRVSP